MQELGMMGESNAVMLRRERTPLSTFLAACAYYRANFAEDDASYPATFEVPSLSVSLSSFPNVLFQIIYMIGWSPHESQPKSLARGSADVSMKDLGKFVKLD